MTEEKGRMSERPTDTQEREKPDRIGEKIEQLKQLEVLLDSHKEALEYVKTKLRVLVKGIEEERAIISRFTDWQDEANLEGKNPEAGNVDIIRKHEAKREELRKELRHWRRLHSILCKYTPQSDLLAEAKR